MEKFILQHALLPSSFVKDFFFIAKQEYNNDDKIISFNLVCKWLGLRKDYLKRFLKKYFEKDYDYSVIKLTKKSHESQSNNFINILVTPDCFKQLCMLSQTVKAKEVRKYYLELEKIIQRYHELIQEQLLKEIGLIKKNQKPKLKEVKGGVIYIIQALNTDNKLMHKLGKSGDIKKRLNTYNSQNANNAEVLFLLKVDDIHSVEKCVKHAVKKYQYRKYKEIYELDLYIFKKVIVACDQFFQKIKNIFMDKKTDARKLISRIKKADNNVFLILSHDEE
jgi:phage anti-repressor protein